MRESRDSGKERNKEERERKRKRQGLYVVVEGVGGGDVTVILATLTHILQPLPQWKKCFSAACNYYRLQIGHWSIGGARQKEMSCTVLCACPRCVCATTSESYL